MSYSQYKQLKGRHPGTVLIMQIGDFYEAFDEDAQILSDKAGQIILTRKFAGQDVRMAGMPCHVADEYIGMLIEAGYRVAVAKRVVQTIS